jgi:hypothetical protein
MAKASKPSPAIGIAILIVVAIAVGAYVWWHGKHGASAVTAPVATEKSGDADEAAVVAIDRIEPANEGRLVTLRGKLDVRAPATDSQLGIRADAVMLFRYADMLQWQEKKDGDKVDYIEVWSPQLIDSSKFHDAEKHRNPTKMPFGIARFSSTDIRLGAFAVDGGILGNSRNTASLHAQPQPHAVSASELPPNLAASFRDSEGMLYAGDPAHRAIGDLRVIYRVIPAGTVEITGIQRGDRIAPQKSVVVDH